MRWKVAGSARLEVLDADGAVLRVVETAATEAVYARAQIIADFGALQGEIRFRVCQISDAVGPGFALDRVRVIDGNRPALVAAPQILKEV